MQTTSPTPSQPNSDRRSGDDRRLDQKQVGGDHYSKLAITPWEALEAWLTPEELRGYFKGEAIVYIAREMSKAGPMDISKARHVLQKLEEVDKRIETALAVRAAVGAPPVEPSPDAKEVLIPLYMGEPVPCTTCKGKPCQQQDTCPFLAVNKACGLSTLDFAAGKQRLDRSMPTAGELAANLRHVAQALNGTARAAGSPATAQMPQPGYPGSETPAA